MGSFVLTLAEARVMYRRYHSLLEKGRKRLPGGEFWKELGTALRKSGASPEAERRRFFLALSLYFLGRRITDRLSPSGFLLRVFSHRAKISPCTTGFRQNARNPSEGRGCGRRLRMGWFF